MSGEPWGHPPAYGNNRQRWPVGPASTRDLEASLHYLPLPLSPLNPAVTLGTESGQRTGYSSSHQSSAFFRPPSFPSLLPPVDPSLPSLQDATLPTQAIGSSQDQETQAGCATRHRWNPPEATWETHKDTIRKLYIDDNQTLDKTMAMMKVDHQFIASKRMYKEKLGLWGFSKNLKKGTVRGIVRRTKQREGRQTEILVNGTQFALDRVQKAYDRHFPPGTSKAPEELTPPEMPGVVVQTPASVANHAQSVARHHIPAELVWTPSNKTPATDRGHFESYLLQTEGRGLPLARLMELRKSGLDFFAQGKNAEAAYDLRTALCGLRHEFGVTHKLPAQTAYDLAEIYESDGDNDKADSVLNWMSESHGEKMGLWHPDTLQHYLHIIEFLQTSSRYEQAKLLAFRIYHAVRDSWGPRRAILIPSTAESDASSPEFLDPEVMDRIFAESSDEMIVRQQLKIANLWATATIPGMENLLQRLITQCERHPASLAREALEARCCLIKQYITTGMSDLADLECKIARDNLAKIILANKETIPNDVLSISIELASLHLQHNNADRCARVVTWTADILETLVSNFYRPQFETNARTAITYFTKVGLRYQEQSGWEDAAPWFERALALVSKVAKCPNSITILLEDAIDRRSFTFEDLYQRFFPEILNIGLYVYVD